jgi:cell shape-determining protein MreD
VPVRSDEDIARTRAFWVANRPSETAAPAYVPGAPVWWHAALALLAALVFQTSFAPFFAFRGATVSFVVIVVAWYGIRAGTLSGLVFGLVAGACEDALAGSSGVAWTFATGLAGLAAGALARSWLSDIKAALVAGVAALTLLRYAAFVVALQMQNRPLAMPETHLHAALWQAALNALVAFVALQLGAQIGGRLAHRR